MNGTGNRIASAIRWTLLVTAWAVPLVFCARLHYPYLLPKLALYRATVAFGLFLWTLEVAFRKEIVFLRSRTSVAVLAFLGAAAVSILPAANRHEAFNGLAHVAAGAALYFLLTGHVRDKSFFIRLFNGIVITGMVIFAYALLQYKGMDFAALRGKTIGTTPTMGVSTLGNVNFLAEYLAIIINFALFLYLGGMTLSGDIAYILPLIMFFASLLMTRSRSGWISLAISITVSLLLILRYLRGRRHRLFRRFTKRKIFVLFALAGIVFFMVNRVRPITSDITFELKTLFTETPQQTNIQRSLIWWCTLNMIRDHPVRGVGIGNFKIEYPRYRSVAEREIAGGRTRIERAHNDYLQVTAEMGIIGSAALLWLIVISFANGRRVLRAPAGTVWKALTVSLLGGFTAILINALFNFPLLNPSPSVFLWLIIGSLALVSSSACLKRNRIEPEVIRIGLRSGPARALLLLAGLAAMLGTFLSEGSSLTSDYYLQRGREHYYFTRWDEAVKSFTRALSYSPHSRMAHHYLANTYNLLGKHGKAAEEYRATLDLHPNYEAAHYGLGSALLALNMPEEAAASYSKAIELRPNYTLAYVQLGKTLEQAGRLDEALEVYTKGAVVEDRMIDFNPLNDDSRYRRASLNESMGNVYMKTGKFKQAILKYREAARGMAHIYYGKGIGSKVKDLTEFDLRVKRAYANIYNAMGAAYASDGQIGEAVSVWQEVLKIEPDNDAARFNLRRAGSPTQ